jgi:hypothetical protein
MFPLVQAKWEEKTQFFLHLLVEVVVEVVLL